MECAELALRRSGFRPGVMDLGWGLDLKQATVPVFLVEDSLGANGTQGGGCGSVSNGSGSDDSFVDELLDLNNIENSEDDENKASSLLSLPRTTTKITEPQTESLNGNSPNDDFGSVLTVPADEPELEWLSQFVEDSFSQFSTPSYPACEYPLKAAQTKSKRSKRARTGGRTWPFRSSSATASSSSSSSIISDKLPAAGKKEIIVRRREGGFSGVGSSTVQAGRRCSHCGMQKTPQWRTGPNGAKTLCNACGVRYKSGRLLPEYRPACSPTFSSGIHSNNHRKVLEMRRKKEELMGGE